MTVIKTYPPWTTVRLAATIRGMTGALADPVTVLVFVGGPDGSVSQFSPTRTSKGVYYYDYFTTTPGGRWDYTYRGSGSVNVASEYTPFNVQIPKF